MIETGLGFLEAEVKRPPGYAVKFGQSSFGIAPEAFDAVDVTLPSSEFIGPVVNPEVLVKTAMSTRPSEWMTETGSICPSMTPCSVALAQSSTISV